MKSLGHNVVSGIKILRKAGLSDQKHLQACIKQEAILLAFDRDFMIDTKYSEMVARSCGIILIEATDTKSETAKKILQKVLKDITENKIKGRICCASIDKVKYIKSDEIKEN